MKADLFSYFIYSLFLAAMVLPSSVIKYEDELGKSNTRYFLVGFIIIPIYVFVVGLRYLVGTDYEVYLGWFNILKSSGIFPVTSSDIGYVWINQMLVAIEAPFAMLFVIIAFVQIFFLYRSFEKMPFLLPYYFFFFFTTLLVFASMNHMRQIMAYYIFFYSISVFLEKRYVLTVLAILLAASLHKSVLMNIWVYPFLLFDWYKNRNIQLALLLVFAVFADKMFSFFFGIFSNYAGFLNYGHYIEQIDLITEKSESFSTGANLGKFLYLILDLTIVMYSVQLKEKYKEYNFHSYYNLYFTGVILESIFASNYIFARTADYLSYFRVLILSFLLFHLIKNEDRKVLKYVLAFLIVLIQLAYYYRGIFSAAANCAPFQFVFE